MVLGAPWVPLGAGRICRVLMEQGRESAGLGGRGFECFAGVSCSFLLTKMLQNSQLAFYFILFFNYYFIFYLDAEFLLGSCNVVTSDLSLR